MASFQLFDCHYLLIDQHWALPPPSIPVKIAVVIWRFRYLRNAKENDENKSLTKDIELMSILLEFPLAIVQWANLRDDKKNYVRTSFKHSAFFCHNSSSSVVFIYTK